MQRSWILTVLAITAVLPTTVSAGAVEWPNGARTAVSLSYDDALASQLDNAVPALDAHGLKATFYLTVGSEAMRERLDDWRTLAAHGHELGNHTVYHPCSAVGPDRAWVEPWNDLDKLSIPRLRREIMIANTFLEAVDGQTQRTYAATCYDPLAGGEEYWPAIQDLFLGLRDLGHGMSAEDKIIWGPSDPQTSGADLIRFITDNTADGRLLGIVFHGVGGDHLWVTPGAHRELVDFLAAHPDVYWVDTYRNIISVVRSQLGPTRGE